MTPPPDSPSGEGTDDTSLLSSRPSPAFTPVCQWVLDTVAEIRVLRAGLRDELRARAGSLPAPVLDDVVQRVVLVASELATNAMRHGRRPAVVDLSEHGERFLLSVADHDPGSAPRLGGDRPPGHGGHGLQIARRLSFDIGWYRSTLTKVVWAEFRP